MEATFPFERAAMMGDPMPEGLTLEDQLAFQALAALYARYHMGILDKDAGKADKLKIKAEYDKRKRQAENNRLLAQSCARLWTELELAACEYAKSKSIEAADRMYGVVYGLVPVGIEEKGR